MKRLLAVVCSGLFCCALAGGLKGAEAKAGAGLGAEELLNRAQALTVQGKLAEALVLATQAGVLEPTNAQCYYVRGRIYAQQGEHAKAVGDFDRILKLEPRAAEVLQLRGVEHFKGGDFKKSIQDFDAYLAILPRQAPYHWQRGIACYYAGEFDKGRDQFELHQTVNSNDVENAVWHFLCVARAEGLEKAREKLIPIQGDARIPMMKVHELFAGKASPEDVLAAAGAGEPAPAQQKQRFFYGHLYLGLYYEALKDPQRTKEHILKSVKDYPDDHYMGDVARVHAKLLGE